MEKFEILKEKITNLRTSGVLLFGFLNRGSEDVSSALQNLVGQIEGLERPVEEICADLKEVSKDSTQKILSEVLHKDMAYGVKIMDENRSSELANDFVSLFGEHAKFFSNQDQEGFIKFHRGETNTLISSPITPATFNVGIFAIGDTFTGFVVVEDED